MFFYESREFLMRHLKLSSAVDTRESGHRVRASRSGDSLTLVQFRFAIFIH